MSFTPLIETGPATFVNHGPVANTSRPPAALLVIWSGSVAPVQAVAGDMWWDTGQQVHKCFDGTVWDVSGNATYAPMSTYEGETLYVYGHSLVQGAAAGVACTPGAEWHNRLAARLGMSAVNVYGVASSRMIDVFNDVQTGVGANAVNGALWVETRKGLVVVEGMLNDAYNPADSTLNSPAVALTQAQANCYGQTVGALLAHLSASTRVDASSGAKTGTWSTTSSSFAYNGGVLDRTNVQNSYVDITVTVPASGIVWLITYSVDTVTNGDMSITDVTSGGSIPVGNVLHTAMTPATIYSRRQGQGFIVNPFPVKMTGLTPGVRTLRFMKTDATSNYIYVDCLLPLSATPPPVAVAKDAIWPVSALTTGLTDSTHQAIGAANTAMLCAAQDTALADFPNAFTIDFTGVTTTLSDVSATDGVHPNDRGMRKMAKAAAATVLANLATSDPDGLYASLTTVASAPLADLSKRSFIPAVATLNGQSGTLTLDLTTGSVFIVNLTGNVTSWNIINPGTTGQDIEIHFVQDATGSRTLAGANAGIRLAGSSLILTTAASHRDVLRLRQIAGGFYETSRSLNLAS